MLIMLLNFLIAIMGAKYEEVKAKEDVITYQTLAAMNAEAMVFYDFYKDVTTSSAIAAIFAKEGEDVSNEYQSITSTIKRAMTKTIGDLREEMNAKMTEVKKDVAEVKAAVESNKAAIEAKVDAKVDDVKVQIQRLITFLKVPNVEAKHE